MRLVVDANIMFSVLIKDSFTAGLVFDERLELFAPEFFLEEFSKYLRLIKKKTKRDPADFRDSVKLLEDIVTVVPKGDYSQFLEESLRISPDRKDGAYFALALKLGCPIWSNDKLLKRQDAVKVYSTSELKGIFGL